MNRQAREARSHHFKGGVLADLKNNLRKAALEKHAAQLAKAKAEDRQKMLVQIDRDIENELRRRMRQVEPDSLLHRLPVRRLH